MRSLHLLERVIGKPETPHKPVRDQLLRASHDSSVKAGEDSGDPL
jgi:hypothetical protein